MNTYITTIAKNEFLYITEFVTYHLNLGFDRIIIYDNNDKDGETYDKLLSKYISSEQVEIVDVRGLKHQLNKVYADAYNRYHHETGWMFFLDVDEFLVLKDSSDVKEYLSRECFDSFNQIFFNWLTMSDDDLVRNDGRPLMTRFKIPVKRMDCPDLFGCTMNRHVKCAVRLKETINAKCNCPHYISNIQPGCDPIGKPLQVSPFNYHPDYSVAYIKHFHFKTIEEYCTNKMMKGFADFERKNSEPFMDFFEKNEMTIEKTKWLIDYIFKLQRK